MAAKSTLLTLLVLVVSALGSERCAHADQGEDVVAIEAAWSRAMLKNDARAMADYLADDWSLIGPDGGTQSKVSFLAVIAAGDLTHDRMSVEAPTVRIYGDTAILTAVAASSGTYKGRPFATRERSTDVFVKLNGRWRCVLTQLTTLSSH